MGLGILLLIIGLLISVGLHEIGHLVPAKLFGAKVSRYFIGFGPTLWSRHARGTEYGIKALPLGGFVAISGMLAPAREGTRTHLADGRLTLAEEARRESAAELKPGEEHMAFWRLAAWKKLIVMLGGPVMNLLIAAVCIAIVMTGIGTPKFTTTVGAVQECVSDGECSDTNPESPAHKAGLHPGDTIISWAGTPVSTWPDVQQAIRESGTGGIDVVIERNGETENLTVTPVEILRPTGDAAEPQRKVPYVGISPQMERERQSLTAIPGATWDLAVTTGGIVAKLPVHLWNTGKALFTGEERDQNGVVGIVGVADLAGEIAGADVAGYGLKDRAADLFMLLGALNMSLFVFNLIPLLPLDGGHILGALIEGGRRRVAAVRRRPDPGAFDTARLLPLSQGVIIFFIAMTLFLVVADIVKPVF